MCFGSTSVTIWEIREHIGYLRLAASPNPEKESSSRRTQERVSFAQETWREVTTKGHWLASRFALSDLFYKSIRSVTSPETSCQRWRIEAGSGSIISTWLIWNLARRRADYLVREGEQNQMRPVCVCVLQNRLVLNEIQELNPLSFCHWCCPFFIRIWAPCFQMVEVLERGPEWAVACSKLGAWCSLPLS